MGKVCSALTGRGKLEDLAPLIHQVEGLAQGLLGATGSRDLVKPVKLSGRRRSLFIGINYIGTQNELHGCINDVRRMMPVVEQLGFPGDDDNRMVLIDAAGVPQDAKPTRAKIIEAMKWLVAGAQTGDALFLHYSGHGGREPARSPNGSSTFHESLVPLDFETAGLLVDADLFTLLVRPLPSGCRLTCVLDSCHSAGALDLPFLFVGTPEELKKGLAGEAVSMFMSKKWSDDFARLSDGNPSALLKDVASMGLGLWNLKSRLEDAADANETGYKKDQASNADIAVGEVLAITGCRSDQTSADVADVNQQFHLEGLSTGARILVDRTKQRGNANQDAGGALTSAFLGALLEHTEAQRAPNSAASQPLTYFALLEKIRSKLSAEGYSQVPQIASSLLVDLKQPFALDTVFVPALPQKAAESLAAASMEGKQCRPDGAASGLPLQALLRALVPQTPASSEGEGAPAGGCNISGFLSALAQHPEGLSMLQQHLMPQQQMPQQI
eukprot:gb/GFBE01039552.1/.p1 GENE.gb/GFBE01039552.1/~~gb/GFBE01039552.1/.p1  ORF type:complete len:499 (+),score=92.01 gb/GFBE01039552.1/:1-1497(+)